MTDTPFADDRKLDTIEKYLSEEFPEAAAHRDESPSRRWYRFAVASGARRLAMAIAWDLFEHCPPRTLRKTLRDLRLAEAMRAAGPDTVVLVRPSGCRPHSARLALPPA